MRRRKDARGSRSLGTSWTKLLRRLPGYDPIATAGECWFDRDAAELAVNFFPDHLIHVKGDLARDSEPFKLAVWQKCIIANLFGWRRPDGTRRFREAFVMVARKNGKTTLCAGICLFMLFCDGEPGAEVYSTASDKDQAAIIYDIARRMVKPNPMLAQRGQVYKSPRAIVYESRGSAFKPLSSEASTKYGYNAHCIVNDELHTHKDRELIDVLETSTGARRQPLIVHITTAGWGKAEHSIGWLKYDYACNVRDGVYQDPYFLPAIYEAPPEADWRRVSTWRLANPNYGVSVRRDYLRRECRKAIEMPSYENTFRRLHLDQWTEQDVRWLPVDKWQACKNAVALEELLGRPCWGALDLSSTTDLTAFVLMFPLDDGRLHFIYFFFVPEDGAHKRERRDKVPYLTWARAGEIHLTPGNVIDYEMVKQRIHWAAESFDLREIALDRWNAAQLILQLEADALHPVPFGQGFASMAGPTKEFEKLILGGELSQDGNPVALWNVRNVATETDAAGNLKPSKKRSNERIDGVVASIMALGRYLVREEPEDPTSVYETRGAIEL